MKPYKSEIIILIVAVGILVGVRLLGAHFKQLEEKVADTQKTLRALEYQVGGSNQNQSRLGSK